MLYELFSLARKAGTAKLEEEVDNPAKGQVFNKYPKFMKNHHALHFLCDTLRMAVTGGVDPLEIDSMMEVDLEVHHKETGSPSQPSARWRMRCRAWASWRRCSAWC